MRIRRVAPHSLGLGGEPEQQCVSSNSFMFRRRTHEDEEEGDAAAENGAPEGDASEGGATDGGAPGEGEDEG
ncbi:hypothetical protein [Sorangium sp. So ce854]|uniref:hypothetical protein n=1 Tax=Sorangium sp. So ce854 TaxID=3133322 RepID=UPI003F642862